MDEMSEAKKWVKEIDSALMGDAKGGLWAVARDINGEAVVLLNKKVWEPIKNAVKAAQ